MVHARVADFVVKGPLSRHVKHIDGFQGFVRVELVVDCALGHLRFSELHSGEEGLLDAGFYSKFVQEVVRTGHQLTRLQLLDRLTLRLVIEVPTKDNRLSSLCLSLNHLNQLIDLFIPYSRIRHVSFEMRHHDTNLLLRACTFELTPGI